MYQRADREVTRTSNHLRGLCSQYLDEHPPSTNEAKIKFYEDLLKKGQIPEESLRHFSHLLENFKWALKEKAYHQDEMKREICENANMRKLLQIPGIGFTTSYALMARIGNINRFEKPSKLMSYMGFNPSMCDGGKDEGSHHASNYGHGYTKVLLNQAARAAYSKGDTNLSHWGYRPYKNGKHYNLIICAIARKMLEIVWHVLNDHPIPNREGEICMRTKVRDTLTVIPKEEIEKRGFKSYAKYAKSIVDETYKDVPEWTEAQQKAREARRLARRLATQARKSQKQALSRLKSRPSRRVTQPNTALSF